MGTAITLSLNGIDIDWRKNRDWTSHHWLFPPGSLIDDVEYRFADNVVEKKAGFQTTLNETYFRLCHLGYSLQETEAKFDDAVARGTAPPSCDCPSTTSAMPSPASTSPR